MTVQNPTLVSKLVSIATLLAVFVPSIWLVLMAFPNARTTLSAAPGRYDIDPAAYWTALAISLSLSITLIGSLTLSAIATLFGRAPNDRPLFLALNAIWAYIGVVAILGKVPGLALLFRTTFTVSNIGWFVVIATGLPVWGPLLLWFFGTANARAHYPPILSDNDEIGG